MLSLVLSIVLVLSYSAFAEEIIATNDDGTPNGNVIYFADKGTISQWMNVETDIYVTAIRLKLNAIPHAVTGKFGDVRISIEPKKNDIWYDYKTDNAPRTIATKVAPNDPSGPSGVYLLGATGLSAVANVPQGGYNANGWQWYRFNMPEPIPLYAGNTYHFVFRKWPVVAGQPKQGKTEWTHAPQDDCLMVPQQGIGTIWGRGGIYFTAGKDLDWIRPDNPHHFGGKMEVLGIVP